MQPPGSISGKEPEGPQCQCQDTPSRGRLTPWLPWNWMDGFSDPEPCKMAKRVSEVQRMDSGPQTTQDHCWVGPA